MSNEFLEFLINTSKICWVVTTMSGYKQLTKRVTIITEQMQYNLLPRQPRRMLLISLFYIGVGCVTGYVTVIFLLAH